MLLDHAALREVLQRVEVVANQVASGREGRVATLRAEGRVLHAKLCDHVDFEDAHLPAALRGLGERGEARLAHLVRDHREQRELLDYALERLRDEMRPPAILARDLLALVAVLRDDMADEERTVLEESAFGAGGDFVGA